MKEPKCAEILCVGTEILMGDIVNTNAAYISRRLAELGINQYRQSVVGDNARRLEDAIRSSLDECDILIMTGGLGPTYDDLTKETAAKVAGVGLTLDERTLERIRGYFDCRGVAMSHNNEKQALIPEGATIFDNDNGTAPGIAMTADGGKKTVIMLPGPPCELIPMFDEKVMPYLKKMCGEVIVSRNVNIYGKGESEVEQLLHELMESSKNPTIAPYCGAGEVRLRVSAKAKSESEGEKMCLAAIEKIEQSPVGKFIYGIDTTIPRTIVEDASRKKLTVATAESCTGGLVAKMITDVPGSSAVLRGGIVSYTDDVKAELLGVSRNTLDTFGAVSERCAIEMAVGARKRLCADIAVSTTGFAGPGGGDEENPVGTVYIGICDAYGASAIKLRFGGNREKVRELASKAALSEILKKIKA